MTQVETKPDILNSIFEILQEHGSVLEEDLWRKIFVDGLWHFFDKVKEQTHAAALQPDILVESSALFKVLDGVISLYEQYFDKISSLSIEIMALLTDFITSDNEHLATCGTTSFGILLSNCGKNFNEQDWAVTIHSLSDVLTKTNPLITRGPVLEAIQQLLPPESPSKVTPTPTPEKLSPTPTSTPVKSSPTPASTPVKSSPTPEKSSNQTTAETSPSVDESVVQSVPSETHSKSKARRSHKPTKPQPTPYELLDGLAGTCRIRIEVLNLLREGILEKYFPQLKVDQIRLLLALAQQSYDVGMEILADDEFFNITMKVWDPKKLSMFIELQNKLTANAMSCYLDCLFKLEADPSPEYQKLAEDCLISSCTSVMRSFMNEEKKLHPTKKRRSSSVANLNTNNRIAQTISSTVPTVLLILDRITSYSDEKFGSVLLAVYPLICDLTLSNNYEVRVAVRKTLWRVGNTHITGFDDQFKEWN